MSSFFDFLEANSMYVVMFVVLIIWIGIFSYMWRLDKKVNNLEKKHTD